MKSQLRRLSAFGLIAAMAGCGAPAPKPVPRLNLVTGKVVLGDNKLDVELANNAIVQFHPKSGESNGKKIWGSINEGSFSIMTEEAARCRSLN